MWTHYKSIHHQSLTLISLASLSLSLSLFSSPQLSHCKSELHRIQLWCHFIAVVQWTRNEECCRERDEMRWETRKEWKKIKEKSRNKHANWSRSNRTEGNRRHTKSWIQKFHSPFLCFVLLAWEWQWIHSWYRMRWKTAILTLLLLLTMKMDALLSLKLS